MTIEQQLSEAKGAFYQALLNDAALTLLVLSGLDAEQTTVPASELPEFATEPWRPLCGSSQKLGLRINRARTSANDELSVMLAVYSYLEVLVISRERSDATLLVGGDNEMFFDGSPALMELDVDDDLRKQAARWFMVCWQEFCRKAQAIGAVLDTQSGTFVTEPRDYMVAW